MWVGILKEKIVLIFEDLNTQIILKEIRRILVKNAFSKTLRNV